MRTRAQASNIPTASNENMIASHNVKRQALEAAPPSQQPQRKRAAFGDITNAIGNVKLHSGKKTQQSSVLSGKVEKKTAEKLTRQRSAVVLPKAPIARIDEMMCVDGASSTSASSVSTGGSPARRTTRRSARSSANTSKASTKSSVDDYMDAEEMWVDPAPEHDYDAGLLADPFSVPHYAMDIFRYYRTRETQFRVGDYMPRQMELSVEMRSALADWMVETQENFELNHETLYQAVKLADMYFARVTSTKKEDVQLVGAAALFIAAKFDERSPPLLDDFLYICDDAYTRDQFMAMERQVLKVVDFDIGMPLSYRYVRRYSKATNAPMEVLTLARFILETSLLHYEFVTVDESVLAAAAFYLANKMAARANGTTFSWSPVLVKYSEMTPHEFVGVAARLNERVRDSGVNANLVTVHNKYSHSVFYEVAKKYKALPAGELA